MQIRQLEIFIAVAHHSSFSRAAEALFLAQPTVSAHVRSLEEELGVRLFHRSTKGLELTAEGHLLFTYASQIVNFCARAQAELKSMAGEEQARLAISASTVPSQYLLPRVMPEVKKSFPGIRFRLIQGDSASAALSVEMGEAEMGIVGTEEQRQGLKYIPVISERLVIVSPDTPFFRAMQGKMPSEVLQEQPFIMRETGSGTRKTMEEFLISQNVKLSGMHIAAEVESTECALRCVENGLGISIVSSLAASVHSEMGRLLQFGFDSPLMQRQFYAVSREDVPISAAASCVMEELVKLGSGAFRA